VRKSAFTLAWMLSLLLAAPALGASKNVKLVDNLPEVKNATAISFLEYEKDRGKHRRGSRDVMLVTGRFGLKSYSLRNPRHPRLLDEITAEDLRLEGDPPVDFTPNEAGTPRSTFWQNEDMDVDADRKLALLSRDPRAYGGTTSDDPNPNPPPGSPTNIAGVYVVDAKDPERLRLLSFQQLPDRSHHDLRERLRVAVDGRTGGHDHAAGPAARVGGGPADHRDRPVEPAPPARLPDGPGGPLPPRRHDRLLA
jgi:hypothetical protein